MLISKPKDLSLVILTCTISSLEGEIADPRKFRSGPKRLQIRIILGKLRKALNSGAAASKPFTLYEKYEGETTDLPMSAFTARMSSLCCMSIPQNSSGMFGSVL